MFIWQKREKKNVYLCFSLAIFFFVKNRVVSQCGLHIRSLFLNDSGGRATLSDTMRVHPSWKIKKTKSWEKTGNFIFLTNNYLRNIWTYSEKIASDIRIITHKYIRYSPDLNVHASVDNIQRLESRNLVIFQSYFQKGGNLLGIPKKMNSQWSTTVWSFKMD